MASNNIYKVYSEELTSGNSPVTLDVSDDLTAKAGDGKMYYGNSGILQNNGNYDLQIEISMDGVTFGEAQVLRSREVERLKNSSFKSIRLTHLGDDTGYTIKAYSKGVGDVDLLSGSTNIRDIDDNTEPQDLLFAESLSQFTTAADTTASTTTTLEYDFTATAGHGLVNGDQILLITTDRSFRAYVTNVVANVITVDTPIDFVFPSGSIGLVINTNMAVDGSATPRIFKVQAGATPVLIRRIVISITDGSSMDDSKFGGIPALGKGLVFRIVNSFQKSIFNFKSNDDFKLWAGPSDLVYSDKSPAGVYGVGTRLTFAGKEKHGTVLKLSGTDELQFVVQDDLTDLATLICSAQGNKFS